MGELYFVLSGRAELRLGDKTFEVGPETAIYTPPGVGHALKTGDEGVRVLIVFPEGDPSRMAKEWLE